MNDLNFTIYIRGLFLLLLIGSLQQTQAQEIHFSQFRNAPLQLSPAMTGVFEGDMRFMANYRSQWHAVPVNYRTVNAAFDTRLFSNSANTGFWGGGLVFNYDWAGDSKLSTAYLAINGSYTRRIIKNNFLTAGVSLGGFQRSFKLDDLQWDDQFDGKQFNGNLANGESFDNTTKFYGDFSAGLNWHFRRMDTKHSRTTFDIGIGALHLNEPKKAFYDNDDDYLPRLFNIYGLATIDIRPKADLVLLATGKYQNTETEHLVGAAARIHLNTQPTQQSALQLGLSYRFNTIGFGNGDALIPNIELHYHDWLFGLSYDINISGFRKYGDRWATENRGGPELALIYTLKNVTDENYCPNCPPVF